MKTVKIIFLAIIFIVFGYVMMFCLNNAAYTLTDIFGYGHIIPKLTHKLADILYYVIIPISIILSYRIGK